MRNNATNNRIKVTLKSEGYTFKNDFQATTFDIDAGDRAVMIDSDRRRRAKEKNLPLDQVSPRTLQEIFNDLWRAEESVAHDAKRGDRGKGKKKCTCGHDCKERQGCRAPESFPWSLDHMEKGPEVRDEDMPLSAENQLLADCDVVYTERMFDALQTARESLSGRHRHVVDLLFPEVEQEKPGTENSSFFVPKRISQADVARELGLTRARVCQLYKEAVGMLREALAEAGFNTLGPVGSGLEGETSQVAPTTERQGE
ncbi:sigma factor-like helix-turn-helix DNA-binding protein [Actinotignum sp. GS-2025c]|uniref:sigma factor-like helix-turn-helix DNA-binding protein n=1 Tax=Actinotignum sp. GS-2025c TaxID=3427276 RepID=UPI003F48ABAB